VVDGAVFTESAANLTDSHPEAKLAGLTDLVIARSAATKQSRGRETGLLRRLGRLAITDGNGD
jgi:hypothetical protein